jgi:hypothetical protein
MARYDAEVRMALDLIKDAGQVVTWQQTATVLGEKPWRPSAGATATFQVPIAFVTGSSLFTRLLAGSNLGVGGIRGLMAKVPFMPQLKDTITRLDPLTNEDTVYGIDSIDLVAPNGQVILYKIGFKK